MSDENGDSRCSDHRCGTTSPRPQYSLKNGALLSSVGGDPQMGFEVSTSRGSSLAVKSCLIDVAMTSANRNSRNFLKYRVLRAAQARHQGSPYVGRINRDIQVRSSLVVKGDALIHGLCLVAWPVGSERRIHRLHHVITSTNH